MAFLIFGHRKVRHALTHSCRATLMCTFTPPWLLENILERTVLRTVSLARSRYVRGISSQIISSQKPLPCMLPSDGKTIYDVLSVSLRWPYRRADVGNRRTIHCCRLGIGSPGIVCDNFGCLLERSRSWVGALCILCIPVV